MAERMMSAALPPLVEGSDRNDHLPALAALAAKVGSSPEQLVQAHGHAIVAKLLYEGARVRAHAAPTRSAQLCVQGQTPVDLLLPLAHCNKAPEAAPVHALL